MSRPRPRSSTASRRSRLLAPLLLAALSASSAQEPPAAAATDATADPGFREYSRVELTLVEAVVLDAKGRHVRAIPRESFRLRANGQAVELLTFDEIDLARAPGSDEVARRTPALPGETTPSGREARPPAAAPAGMAPGDAYAEQRARLIEARRRGERWFVMVLDGYNNVSPLKMSQVRRAAKKWIDANLRTNDRVAVFELNPFLASLTSFTSNAYDLKKAIDTARIFPGENMGRQMLEQRIEQGGLLTREALQDQLLNSATFGGDLLAAERDTFYNNMSSLSEVLTGLDGTRAMLVFSGGFPVTTSRATGASGGFTPRFRDMLRALEARGVRVFTFDTGVEGGFTDASESTNYRLALDQLGLGTEWLDELQVGARIDATNAHQEILSLLGSETGGRFWRSRDYADGLRAVDDDLSHYYLIGYDAAGLRRNRKGYSRIKVEADVPGGRVIARQGVFDASPPAAGTETAAPVRADAPAPLERWTDAEPLSVVCHPLFYPGPRGQTLVVLPVRVAGPLAATAIGGGQRILDLDLTVAAKRSGVLVGDGRRHVRLGLDDGLAARVVPGVHLRDAILLPPTSGLQVAVDVRLNGTGRSGRWVETIDVPDRSGGAFGLTDLAVLAPADPAPLIFDVFGATTDAVHGSTATESVGDPLGQATGRPNAYVDGGVPNDVPLLAQVQVTAPPPPRPDLDRPLRMDWELLPRAGGAALAPPVRYRRLQLVEDGSRLDVVVDLDLAGIAPGDYELRLTAENLIDRTSAVRSRRLVIGAARAAPASAE